MNLPSKIRKAILSKYTSRINKYWIIKSIQPIYYLKYKWAGIPYNSRMLFQFEEDGDWVIAKSFEEDLWPTYKFAEKKSS